MVRAFFLLFLLLAAVPLRAEEKVRHFKVRGGYLFQDISFTSNAHGANLQIIYEEPKKWGVRGGFHYINKFGDSAPGYDLGGTWWATPSTTLSLDIEVAPEQLVIPRQAYTFEVSQTLVKGLVGSLAYRFADYQTADAHTMTPTLTWYFYPRWDVMVRYFLTINRFAGLEEFNHSAMARINWNVIDPFVLFAGYSRANESFDSGSPVAPLGGFSANHAFGGFKWEFYKGLGIDFTFDYENRNNGAVLNTYDVGLFYRW